MTLILRVIVSTGVVIFVVVIKRAEANRDQVETFWLYIKVMFVIGRSNRMNASNWNMNNTCTPH